MRAKTLPTRTSILLDMFYNSRQGNHYLEYSVVYSELGDTIFPKSASIIGIDDVLGNRGLVFRDPIVELDYNSLVTNYPRDTVTYLEEELYLQFYNIKHENELFSEAYNLAKDLIRFGDAYSYLSKETQQQLFPSNKPSLITYPTGYEYSDKKDEELLLWQFKEVVDFLKEQKLNELIGL